LFFVKVFPHFQYAENLAGEFPPEDLMTLKYFSVILGFPLVVISLSSVAIVTGDNLTNADNKIILIGKI
jgi:hypothetical protein